MAKASLKIEEFKLLCDYDKVNKEINDIIEEFRRNLEPLYMDRQSKWVA